MSDSSPQPRDGAFFPYHLAANDWLDFEAEGFTQPVTGVIYRSATPVRGVPLGGLGTGFMHLGPDGRLDRNTIFDSFLPPDAAVGMTSFTRSHVPDFGQPFLGLCLDDRVWVLALPKRSDRTGWAAITEAQMRGAAAGDPSRLAYADELHYWGHYPVADLEFETSAPVRIGVRAWTPFVLGDAEASNTPGSAFLVRVRNVSPECQQGSIVCSFPGWLEREAHRGQRGNTELRGAGAYARREVDDGVAGVEVTHWEPGHELGYALGVIGASPARTGGGLGESDAAWSQAGQELPPTDPSDPGASLAVDFDLQPGESADIQLILAWYAPFWRARPSYNWAAASGWKPYVHHYHQHFKSAAEVASHLASNHRNLLQRTLAWQQALYTTPEFPGWLSDSLVNIFHVLAQNSFWARSAEPDHWAGDEGLFNVNESLLSCPQFCTPCDWIGNFPILLFFPELAHRSLQALAHRQDAEGRIPFGMGAGTVLDDPYYGIQYSTDNQVFVHLVARLWQRTGDDAIVQEFYPAVKKAIDFLMSVDEDDDGIVDAFGASWFYEGFSVRGAVAYVGGLWVTTLALAAEMARTMDDADFLAACESWRDRAATALEALWNEDVGSYLLFRDPVSGASSDVIQSDQLTGEWAARFHGVAGAFPPERVARVQDTVWRIHVAGSEAGARTMMHPSGAPYEGGYIVVYGTLAPAMLRMYDGDLEAGLDLVHRMWHNLTIRQGYTWDQPTHLGPDGKQLVGHDYYHNTMLWAVPAAMLQQDLNQLSAPGGFVDHVLRSARAEVETLVPTAG